MRNCRTYTHHRFSVTTTILCSSVWSASAEVFFLQGFGSIERTQNIFTQSFKKLSTAKIHFGWEFFESIFFSSCVGRKILSCARAPAKKQKKNKFETSPPKRRGFIYDFLLLIFSRPMTFSSLRFLFSSNS